MSEILRIPEIRGLDTHASLIRIPPELDVPLTDRVRRLIDTAEFRRLARISQLGLVSLVYPAGHHTRFEHSLGVYRLALLFLKQIAHHPRFQELLTPHHAEILMTAALLHDIGHWPFCHLMEDLALPGISTHEKEGSLLIHQENIAGLLRKDWGIKPEEIGAVLTKQGHGQVNEILMSILSGPIDIDKMDYLFRDSLHAGVPYGRHFDQGRLIASLCLNEKGNGLAVTEKGKTAAELMVFARYVMFSEVYWHHSVRCAAAMLQRGFYEIMGRLDFSGMLRLSEAEMIEQFLTVSRGTAAEELFDGLFGSTRRLYKRVVQYSILEQPEIYRQLAGKPYPWLCRCAKRLVQRIRQTGISDGHRKLQPTDILLDAPPVEKEVEFRIDVYYPKTHIYRPFETVSPVVRALAKEQFDDYVKKVRIFAAPDIAASLREPPSLASLITDAIREE
ncbi:MAG: HD domain-containing protein [Planctomycetaceae bacterium]|jgi:HD superfamily phosphohydrolase|nr:HD domain-containing protein [Planctomycetaceae bacterium]